MDASSPGPKNCPVCGQPMEYLRSDQAEALSGEPWVRHHYRCTACGRVWIRYALSVRTERTTTEQSRRYPTGRNPASWA
jgi:hypothetical protein